MNRKLIIHHSSFIIRKSSGFTLIELMVAIGIMAILGTIGIAGFVNYNQAQVLKTSASDVASMLNLAKSRAQSQVKLSCTSLQALEGYSVDISIVDKSYTLNSQCLGANELDTKVLPQNISFKTPDTSPTSFFFPIKTGGVQTPGQIVISGSGGETKTIIINSLGLVTIQ